ncbi:hypothetical protein [Streptomyces sp. NPDC046925]|uniref:hypothetical protein n=1 Tax=Streptomyces sp. NPDC046925 TaxID=3155375 RepID=UPI0033FCC7F9
MSKAPRPHTVRVDGRTYISRAGIAERTGASQVTAKTWYAKRLEQPEESRHPEKGPRIDRTDYYDLEEFDRFYAWRQESKKKAVLPTAPELYEGGPDDEISINRAAEYFHFAGASVIRKYLADNPGYFPEPVGTVAGPTGRQIKSFRRKDLQDFDRRRNGDNTGVSGSPGGPRPGGTTPEVQERIDTAAARLRELGRYRSGIAAELAAEHGGSESAWQRAVRQARQTTGIGAASPRDARVALALARLEKAGGYHRGVAAELAAEHGGAERTWQNAVQEAREQLTGR